MLAGLKTFDPDYSDQSRCLQVLRGLHGFHNYATEYWIEYLLSSTTSVDGNIDTSSRFFILSSELSKRLKELNISSSCEDEERVSELHEDQLTHLKSFTDVCWAARGALLERQIRYPETPQLWSSE